MGDKETFSSELDRLINPYIEYWGEHNELLPETAVYRPDDPEHEDAIAGTWRMDLSGAKKKTLYVDWVMVDGERLMDSISDRVTWKGTVVYERGNGQTKLFHPGWEWIEHLLAATQEHKQQIETTDLYEAYDRHVSKQPNFAPL